MAFIKNTDTLVEGALQKFFTEQRAKDALSPELSQVNSAISAEEVARQSADSQIEGRLDVLEGSGEGSVAKAEQDAKDYADQKVADLVNSAPAVLDTLKELSDALGGDENFAVTVANQIGAVDSKVEQEISDRQAAVSAEQGRAQAAEEALDGRLDIIEGADSVEGSVAKAEKDAKDFASGLVSAEESARMAADSALSGRLSTLESDPTTQAYVDGQIASEASARQSADSLLSGRLDQLELDPATGAQITQLQSDLSAEESARQSADNLLGGRLDILEGADTVEGSVAKSEKDSKDYTDSQIGNLEGQPDVATFVGQLASSAFGAISAEQARAEAAEGLLDGRVSALESDATTKTYVDGEIADLQGQITQEVSDRQAAVSAEQSARETAVSGLDSRVDALEADATTKSYVDGEVSDLQGQINQEISNRQSAVSGEQSRAEAAEGVLDGKIETEKGRIDAILSASQADKDSFAEIVSLINSVDTANDQAFAGYVLSNDAALAQEVSDRQAGDSALDSRLDVLEGSDTVAGSVAKSLKDAKAYTDSEVASEASARASAVSAEQARAEGAESALSGRIATLELDPVTKSYTDSELAKKVDVTTNYDIKPGLYQGGSKSANFQINWANGPFQQFTLGASMTVTFANPVTGGSYMLKLVQDGTGSRQITWPMSVEWANGEAPTLSGASKVDFIQMVYDGTSYHANYQLEDVTFAKSSELDSEVASLQASITAEESARQAEDLTFFKLDGSRAMTGGMKVKHSEKSANYTLSSSDYMIGVTSVAGSKTMTLPSASSEGAGRVFVIKDQSGSASASNYIRVAAPSGQTLDGQGYYDIKVPYESVMVVSNGSHWFIV